MIIIFDDMDSFVRILPTLRLSSYVKEYWFLSTDGLSDNAQKAIPSGCISLSFKRKGDIFSVNENRFLPSACVFGQSTQNYDFSFSSFDLIMILFQPLGAQYFFDVPMSELKNRNVDINDLNNYKLIELQDKLINCINNESCVHYIEQFLIEKTNLSSNDTTHRLSHALDLIDADVMDVTKLASEACLSYKQFKRFFQDNIGLNPKEYIKIHRFSKVLKNLQYNLKITIEELADDNNYYDKSHLIKESRILSSYSPSELKLLLDPYTSSRCLFQSFFINTK